MVNVENITVVIPSWNEKENLKQCVELIEANYPNINIIVVNNGSTDGTQKWLESQEIEYVYFDEGVQTVGKVLNEVIDNFDVQEYICVIWPQVRVGKKTITAMIDTLCGNERNGVAGCRANGQVYEQDANIRSYGDLLEIENTSMEDNDFEVVGTEGLCYCFNTKIINSVGKFDENLAYTDIMVDFQLRTLLAGYRNMISRNSYVYETETKKDSAGWINQLCVADRRYLRKKWNTNYFMLAANNKFNLLIDRASEEKFSVLEVGCDMGANLLGIKNAHPNCKIYGLEINKSSVNVGKHVADICYGNIEEENVDFGEKFDYIIFGDVLEHLHNPLKTIEYCRTLLKKDGCIVASIPNVMHVSVMEQLLRGEFRYTEVGLLDRTHIHLFTQKEIIKMFTETGYDIEKLQGVIYELTPHQEELIPKLMSISENVSENMYQVYQYSVVARMLS